MKTMRVIYPAGLLLCAAFLFPGMAAADDADAAVIRPNLLSPPGAPSRVSWKPLRYGVAVETRTSWQLDKAAERLMGKRAPTGAGVSLLYDALGLDSPTVLALDLGWLLTTASPTLDYSGVMENLRRNEVGLGISLRYQVWRWLAPYARIAGGMGWDKLKLSESEVSLSDTRSFGEGSLGGGLFLRTPGLQFGRRYNVGIVARVEGGYALGTSTAFVLKPSQASSDSNAIPMASVPIGRVTRHVPYLRVMVGLGF